MTPPEPVEAPANPEDVKIITLARSARARTGAAEGACLRDGDGRTYAAASVARPHLTLSAIQLAVAMAVSSGATGVEAVALVGAAEVSEADLDAVRDFGSPGVVVWLADNSGTVLGAVDV